MTRNVAVAAAVALAGCVSLKEAVWWPAEPSFVAGPAGFEVAPPPGWMRSSRTAPGTLLVTRDGTALQSIVVGATPVGEAVGAGDRKRVVAAGMSPQELAELVFDGMRANEGLTELRLVESAPAALSGKAGFRVIASYRSAGGLARRAAIYGAIEGERFYWLSYVAPERVYFARDLPTFEALVRTFRLRAPEPAPWWRRGRR
jgi:hypothetical protein